MTSRCKLKTVVTCPSNCCLLRWPFRGARSVLWEVHPGPGCLWPCSVTRHMVMWKCWVAGVRRWRCNWCLAKASQLVVSYFSPMCKVYKLVQDLYKCLAWFCQGSKVKCWSQKWAHKLHQIAFVCFCWNSKVTGSEPLLISKVPLEMFLETRAVQSMAPENDSQLCDSQDFKRSHRHLREVISLPVLWCSLASNNLKVDWHQMNQIVFDV